MSAGPYYNCFDVVRVDAHGLPVPLASATINVSTGDTVTTDASGRVAAGGGLSGVSAGDTVSFESAAYPGPLLYRKLDSTIAAAEVDPANAVPTLVAENLAAEVVAKSVEIWFEDAGDATRPAFFAGAGLPGTTVKIPFVVPTVRTLGVRANSRVAGGGASLLNFTFDPGSTLSVPPIYLRRQPLERAQTSVATLTPNVDLYDIEIITAQAAALAIAAPTGTPGPGQALTIRLRATGSTRTITSWDAVYNFDNVAEPTEILTTQDLYARAYYNATTSKWDVLAVSNAMDATLAALAGLDSTPGIVVETAADAFTKRSLAVGTDLSIANPAGTAGNPTISLGTNVVTSIVNDTNVTGSIAANALTLAWTGTLAKARQHANTVYNDQANTFSTGAQDLGSAISFKVPTSAGAAPTVSGLIAYDSTANKFKGGANGSGVTFATESFVTGGYQPLDSDLTTIAGLTATTDNFIVSVASAWASRTPAQVKSTLSLGNVDNTSDATKNAAVAVLTNKDLSSGTNTFPTLNQNTTGSAAKWTTARNLAGNSVDGSANVAFANKFIVQGTADSGLSAAQFLGALGTGIVKNTTTTGVLSIAVAGDFPTLNQNTTGSAATLTTPRAIYGNNFDGSAALSGIIASTYGGTGNGFTKFSGPATSEKTFTLPNASAAILTDNAVVTIAQGGTNAATASAARSSLGLAIGSNVQAWDADLDTIAGLTATTDNFIVSVSSAWASRTPAQVKSTLSLNNVENTALSTWGGSANITTLGTVGTGTWHGSTVDVAYGGTGDTGTAWTAYTPTVSAGAGTFTSASATGSYKKIGKTVWYHIYVTITTNGTAAAYVQVTLPFTAPADNDQRPASGVNVTNNSVLACYSVGNTANMYILKYDGSYPGANATTLAINGCYETA